MFCTVAKPLEVEGLSEFEDHVGCVIGSGTVDAESDGCTMFLEIEYGSDAGCEHHIGGGAVTDSGVGGSELFYFLRIEVDAVGKPSTVFEPPDLFEVVDGSASEFFEAELFFVMGFCEVCMESDIIFFCEFGGRFHEFCGDGKGGARSESNLYHGPLSVLMV